MKLMVTGASGQVGWELVRALAPLGEIVAVDRSQCDLVQPYSVVDLIRAVEPNVIISAAAYTSVDKAEEEEDLAQIVNGTAVQALAEAARAINALLVHYSTDYVFDGKKDAAYDEDDAPSPINAYGRSKLAGERAIRNSRCDYLILRTSWVYAARGNNFLRTVLRLARERDELSIVADRVGAPNWARNLADATAHIVRQAVVERTAGVFLSGLFHLTAYGSTTWHGFAAAILQRGEQIGLISRQRLPRLLPIPTEAYPRPALRPKNSCLVADRLRERFNIAAPDWSRGLELCLQELNAFEIK